MFPPVPAAALAVPALAPAPPLGPGFQEQGPDLQHVGGRRRVHLAVQVMVVRVGGFQHPPLNLFSGGPLGDLMLRRDLLRILQITVFMHHPGSVPVWPPHAPGDHVLVLAAVHKDQLHTVGPAPGLVHGGDLVMALEGRDALTGPHPVHVHGAELIHRVGLVAAVHQGQVHHDFSAVRQGKLGIHNPFHFRHGKRLAVGHVLGGHKVAPCSDHPVQAIFLHVDPAGQQFCPRREGPGRNLRLPLHDHFGVGFQFRVLPWLRQPRIDEVVEQFRVVLGPHELPGDVGNLVNGEYRVFIQ